MKPITCNCAPYGVLHSSTCPVGRVMLEATRREERGLDVEQGAVLFSSGFLKRMAREEGNALAGRGTDWRFVRPEVVALCAARGLPVKAAYSPVEATATPKAPRRRDGISGRLNGP